MGNIFGNLANFAVKASPYALQAVVAHQAEQEQERQAALKELYARNADNRAGMAASIGYAKTASDIMHTDASTQALRNPSVSVKYTPDANGNMQGLPTKVQQGEQITPMATGMKVPPKPAPRIDPLSKEGVAAGVESAGKKAAATAPFRPKPQQPGVFVADPSDPSGAPVYTPRDQAFGERKPTAAPGGGGGQSLSSDDRAKMLAQAKLDNETMKAYEAQVLAGKKKVGAVKGIAGAMAQGGGGVAANVGAILGNSAVGMTDADYQKYITAQRSYGRIMGNLQSKRYTDHQAEIERSISGLQGNDLNGTISYKQQLRDASLADALQSPGGGGGGRGGGGASARDPGGNVDLGKTPPKKAAGGRDYGIFGKPPSGEDDE